MMIARKIAFVIILLVIETSICAAYNWDPIIGIPQPVFGLNERPSLPLSWTSEQAGYYFVSQVGCSDSRVYGHPGAPRCTLPSYPSAGSVITLNGTYQNSANINWNGTSQTPIYIIGYNTSNKPTVTGTGWGISGSNIYIIDINFNKTQQDSLIAVSGTYITIRGCSFQNGEGGANGSVVYLNGASYVLFDSNSIGPSGNWQFTGPGDIDRHGIKTGNNGNHYWIVRSTFFHIQGDGVQIGDQNSEGGQYIYIGKNLAYENCQSGFWNKRAIDVIYSQNTIHDISTSCPGGDGQGIGSQYNSRYVWYLANKFYNQRVGIRIASTDGVAGENHYAIGNVAYDGITSAGTENRGIDAWGGDEVHVLYNTIVNYNRGILLVTNKAKIYGNLTAGVTTDIRFENGTGAGDEQGYNLNTTVANAGFTNATSKDFSLGSTSSAINAGQIIAASAFATFQSRYGIDIKKDMVGTIRPQGSAWDIGAYEAITGQGGGGGSTTPMPPTDLRIQ